MRLLFAVLAVAGSAITVVAADPPAPSVAITMGTRRGQVTPCRQGFAHTGGGNIDVAQPSPDTVVITMNGVAVAGGHPSKSSVASLQFELDQCFDVVTDDPKLRRAKLVMDGRVIGLLRSHNRGGGTAQQGPGCAIVSGGPLIVGHLCVPAQSVACGSNLSLNAREGPIEMQIAPGKFSVRQTFSVNACHPISLWPCKAASAEFAPDPALDPLWISYWEPFHGAVKKDFGFQVTIKVVADR